MIRSLRQPVDLRPFLITLIPIIVLALAVMLGQQASTRWLLLLAVGLGGLVLLTHPALGLLSLVQCGVNKPIVI